MAVELGEANEEVNEDASDELASDEVDAEEVEVIEEFEEKEALDVTEELIINEDEEDADEERSTSSRD